MTRSTAFGRRGWLNLLVQRLCGRLPRSAAEVEPRRPYEAGDLRPSTRERAERLIGRIQRRVALGNEGKTRRRNG